MLNEQIRTNPKNNARCDDRTLIPEHGRELSPLERNDAGLKAAIAEALWKDDVLRALEYYEIDVRVQNGVVHLNGYIVGAGSQNRIHTAIRAIPGIVEIQDNLTLDDELTLDVASALGDLEHEYDCKFFTGASHGVISINGNVKDRQVRLLAEKCVSENPNTRGVINNIQVLGKKPVAQNQPFLLPAIGQTIYFLDWASGVVKQVIMNPNNRRVIAIVAQGKFTNGKDEINSMDDGSTLPSEKLVVIPVGTVRHLTRTSGFLYIKSDQRNQYMNLLPAHFISPPQSWVPPYPYCPDDVLFPVEYKDDHVQIEYKLDQYSFAAILSKDTPLGEQLLANDSLGG